MTGYTRADSVNNIADGNIINASDLDGEFDAVQAAFNSSTGHVHDGTAANGAPITKIGPTQDVVASATALTPKTTATVDVGSSALKFKDFFFSGTGTLVGLTATGAITLNTTTNNQSYTTTGAGTITISSGTAGSINNMNIGATTAGTGKFTAITNSALTSGRVVYATTGGLETDSANLLYSGTDLTVYGITVGRGAGAVSTNTAVGASALVANTSGTENTAVGNIALYLNQAGAINTAVGRAALYSNVSGNYNSAVGEYALFANTGSYNTALGAQALNTNIAASNNTAVGYQAGYSNTTGANNVAFGYQAGYTLNSNYNAIFGYTAAKFNTGSLNTVVGALALGGNSGAGSYNTAVGYTALNAVTSGNSNVAVGGGDGATYNGALGLNQSGAYNTAVGNGSLQANTTASNNTAVGYQALYSQVAGGANNTAFGYQAGYTATQGSNTFIGYKAGYLSTGFFNTFVGTNEVGSAMTTGTRNTILGKYDGNQGGLDIRTADNYIVLSDGDGNPVIASPSQTEVLMRSGSGLWTLFSNGGGNNSTYNGALIGANKGSITGQSNASLPSWFIDIGGRAADGSTRPVSTGDKFSVGRQAAGGTLVGAANLFEVNANGAVGLNTTAASTGTGITFPATQSASTNANTLDDYERGTFTPVIVGSTTNPTVVYSSQNGNYVKIGQLVYFNIFINITSVSGGSGSVYINGLPFTSLSTGSPAPPVSAWLSATSLGANNIPSPIVIYGNTQIWMSYINNLTGAGYTVINVTQLAAGNEWRLSGCYQTAA